jgi:hypothetical protein
MKLERLTFAAAMQVLLHAFFRLGNASRCVMR